MDSELVKAKETLRRIQEHIQDLDVHQRVVELMNSRAEFLTEQIVNALEGKPVESVKQPYFVTSQAGTKSF
jgi:hypothetical protein